MYIPDHFRMSDEDTQSFLREVRHGTLITIDQAQMRPVATLLPWTLIDGDRLTSHIARVNPQSTTGGPTPPQALVIVMGEDSYISDTWMSPGAVPTWNYETIHIYGDLFTHDDPDWIIDSWSDMLKRFSTRTLADYDRDWLEKQARAVTGIEVRITGIQAKSKLSQNRSESDATSIIDHLEPSCPHLADRMRQVSLPHIAARDERVRNAVPYL